MNKMEGEVIEIEINRTHKAALSYVVFNCSLSFQIKLTSKKAIIAKGFDQDLLRQQLRAYCKLNNLSSVLVSNILLKIACADTTGCPEAKPVAKPMVVTSNVTPITRADRLLEYKPTSKGGWKIMAYALEEVRWPVERKVNVTPAKVAKLYSHLEKIFKLPAIETKWRQNRYIGAGCFRFSLATTGRERICLRYWGGETKYSTAVHEFAHYVAQYGKKVNQKHGDHFWSCLEKCYLESNKWMYAQSK